MHRNRTLTRLIRVALLVVFSVSAATAAAAQSAPSIGHSLEAAAQNVTVRRSDSLVNGALIGAGVGVASVLALCRLTEPWRNCRDDFGPMLAFGAIGAGVGIGIDALIRPSRVHAVPMIGRRAGGVRLAVGF